MFNRGPGGGGDPGGGGFFANFFGNAMHNPNARFDVQYRCYPVSFAGREDLESGNKIILPSSALDNLARLNISYPMLFEASNGNTHRTHCGVQEFVAEEGTCYLPYWMMQNLLLSEGDLIRIMNTSLPKGKFVKLRPVTSDFLSIHNPKTVLENSLRGFATLTVGDCISITYNKKRYEIEIMECKPANAICVIETDVNVDFAPPKDYVEPQVPPSLPLGGGATGSTDLNQFSSPDKTFGNSNMEPSPRDSDMMDAASSIASTNNSRVFGGAGQRLDGKPARLDQLRDNAMVSPRDLDSSMMSDASDDTPWISKRIPGGVREEPPYGYNTGNMMSKEGYEKPAAGGNKKQKVEMTMVFEGEGHSLE
ncbi:unnamed protein product [Amoebophrya sp. A120]|nr:unnamed protein product [Amoebophrya sp. A120]|eukprot:GSA120T00010479001.1